MAQVLKYICKGCRLIMIPKDKYLVDVKGFLLCPTCRGLAYATKE